jgi:hypothetical protein
MYAARHIDPTQMDGRSRMMSTLSNFVAGGNVLVLPGSVCLGAKRLSLSIAPVEMLQQAAERIHGCERHSNEI